MTELNEKLSYKKNVLFIAHDDKFIKHFLLEHKKVFENLGAKVFFATNNKFDSFENRTDIDLIDIDIEQSPFKLVRNFKALRQIKKFISDNDIDIIYAHTPVGGVLGRLAKIGNKGLTVMYMPHGYHFLKGSGVKSWVLYYPVEKILSYCTDFIITINREDFKITRKRMSKKVSVKLINGVGVENYDTSNELKLRKKEDPFIITHVAELNDNKNQLCLIKAVESIVKNKELYKDLPPIKTIFIGEGRNMEMLKSYVSNHNLQDIIEFTGYIENVKDYLMRSNCAISCSKREGLPVNMIESLSYGIPIIATNCRGNRDVVQNGVNGYLTTFNDSKELANRLLELMSDSDEYIRNFYENNKMKSEIYSTKIVNRQLEEIFSECFELSTTRGEI